MFLGYGKFSLDLDLDLILGFLRGNGIIILVERI